MTWHIDDDTLRDYVDGSADALTGSSTEQHVVRCADCRARLAERVDSPVVPQVWERLALDLQAPRTSWMERLLGRLGMAPRDALLLWTAPAFRTPWLAATFATFAFSFWAATISDPRGLVLFLFVAPMLPVAGVALAYGPDVDDSYELSVAAPYSSLRLLLLRSLAVLATTAPVTVAVGVLLPGETTPAVAWLVPSLACVAVTLAASTWVGISRAAIGVSVAWGVAVVSLSGPRLESPALAVAPEPLLVYGVLAVLAAATLWARGHHLNQIGTSR